MHVVPVWQEDDGSRTFGLAPRCPHPPVVGWSNVARIWINGELRWFALTTNAAR